jgi:hypothetical protein
MRETAIKSALFLQTIPTPVHLAEPKSEKGFNLSFEFLG